VAGEVADGLIAHSFTTRRYLQEVTLPTVRAGLARGGRAEEDFDLVYAPFVVTGTDEQSMANSAAVTRERIAFYASTPSYRGVLELHGWGDLDELPAAFAQWVSGLADRTSFTPPEGMDADATRELIGSIKARAAELAAGAAAQEVRT
jgi:hypothetical protein